MDVIKIAYSGRLHFMENNASLLLSINVTLLS